MPTSHSRARSGAVVSKAPARRQGPAAPGRRRRPGGGGAGGAAGARRASRATWWCRSRRRATIVRPPSASSDGVRRSAPSVARAPPLRPLAAPVVGDAADARAWRTFVELVLSPCSALRHSSAVDAIGYLLVAARAAQLQVGPKMLSSRWVGFRRPSPSPTRATRQVGFSGRDGTFRNASVNGAIADQAPGGGRGSRVDALRRQKTRTRVAKSVARPGRSRRVQDRTSRRMRWRRRPQQVDPRRACGANSTPRQVAEGYDAAEAAPSTASHARRAAGDSLSKVRTGSAVVGARRRRALLGGARRSCSGGGGRRRPARWQVAVHAGGGGGTR